MVTSELQLTIDSSGTITPLKEFISSIPNQDVVDHVWKLSQEFFPRLILNATTNLSKAILDQNIKIDKSNPFIETSYPVEVKWSDIEKNVTEKLNKLSNNNQNEITHIPLNNKQEQILNLLNGNRISIVDNEIEFEIPNEYLDYHSLTNGNFSNDLIRTKTPISIIKFHGEFKRKKKTFEGLIFILFMPLFVVRKTQEIRFPIFVGLKTLNDTHKTFSKKIERLFWEQLLSLLKKELNLLENNTFIQNEILSAPKIPIIKSPMHLESLKHGRNPDPQLKLPFCVEGKPPIEVIGLDLQKKHYHALNAIQKFLQETNYKGNVPGTQMDGSNSFNFTGYLPQIKISRAQYLESYGVTKNETSRGKCEYSGIETEEALSALRDLCTQNHLIISRRVRKVNGNNVIDLIQTVSPIIRIFEGWEGLTKKEDVYLSKKGENEKIRKKHMGFVIEPCPLLVDQIDKYFVLKPANMYQEIRLKFPNASKYSYALIDWILQEAHLKKSKSKSKDWPETIETSRDTVANALRLDCYVKTRNWKRIEQILSKCIQIAISLGWISKHDTIPGKTVSVLDRFFLNKEKFDMIHKNSAIENS